MDDQGELMACMHCGCFVKRLTFDCDFRVGTRLQRVLKPIFMFDRLFCSADMWVVLRLCHTAYVGNITQRLNENVEYIKHKWKCN